MDDELTHIRTQRDQRRLNCAVFQAELHATGAESRQLLALKHAARSGEITYADAIAAVNALRRHQHERTRGARVA